MSAPPSSPQIFSSSFLLLALSIVHRIPCFTYLDEKNRENSHPFGRSFQNFLVLPNRPIALPLHTLARLFSGATMGQLDFLAQCVNAALGIAGAGVLAALAQELLDRRAASATLLLYIASLPTLLFAQFVYNINLMILLGAGATLCFAR